MEGFKLEEFKPDVSFTQDERAQIAHTSHTPGFLHINRIMRAQVDKFVLDWINVDEDDEKKIIAKHRLSKAAAQFYQLVVSRINWEIQQFTHEANVSTAPTDPTEGMLDLGKFAHPDDPEDKVEDLLHNFEFNAQLAEEETSIE